MSGHEGASFSFHISPSAFASRTQSGGTTSGPARLSIFLLLTTSSLGNKG